MAGTLNGNAHLAVKADGRRAPAGQVKVRAAELVQRLEELIEFRHGCSSRLSECWVSEQLRGRGRDVCRGVYQCGAGAGRVPGALLAPRGGEWTASGPDG